MSGAFPPQNQSRSVLSQRILTQRGLLVGVILAAALVGFEMFNYSTTEVALRDLLGDLKILGLSWATVLTFAFCGIDFAGIARLFIPESDQPTSNENWFLFGAWLLAATMNAVLTWWGISLGLVNRLPEATAFIDPNTITGIVPVFVALMVWVTRILLIGSFSISGARLFSEGTRNTRDFTPQRVYGALQPLATFTPTPHPVRSSAMSNSQARPRSSHRPEPYRPEPEYVSEPGYAAADGSAYTLGEVKETGRPTNRGSRF
ncbi:MAG TPA: hypothetical protein VN364_14640 [Bellilinea sp.]|nr:hypothetical protein [Bellilinea sp.]